MAQQLVELADFAAADAVCQRHGGIEREPAPPKADIGNFLHHHVFAFKADFARQGGQKGARRAITSVCLREIAAGIAPDAEQRVLLRALRHPDAQFGEAVGGILGIGPDAEAVERETAESACQRAD